MLCGYQRQIPSPAGAGLKGTDIYYDMYVLPVKLLLGMGELEPHQVLLSKGLLKKWEPSMDGKIIFVSHEWLGFGHADPAGEHFRTLKSVLQRLASGKVDVKTHWMAKLAYKVATTISAREWASEVSSMYVWFDFMSVPQLSCVSSPTPKSADHRFVEPTGDSERETAEALRKAVDSIPGYIERARFMFVLVPVCQHSETCQVCNYASWRSRGWCRLELTAAHLATARPHIVVCEGPQCTPYIQMPLDVLELSPGTGQFTCCARGHRINGRRIECDKSKIGGVLETMIGTYASYLKQTAMDYEYMDFLCLCHRFVQGLKTSIAGYMSSSGHDMAGLLRAHAQGKAKRSMVELAVLSGNVAVLKERLASSKDGLEHLTNCENPKFGIMKGMTPLMCAMAVSNFEVVEALLDARADPTRKGGRGGWDAFQWACVYSRTANIAGWLMRFPSEDIERRDTHACNSLILASTGPLITDDAIRLLLAAGGDVNHTASHGATALHAICSYPETSPEILRMILSRAKDPSIQMKPRSQFFRALFRAARLFTQTVGGDSMMAEVATWEGRTPLHAACQTGNAMQVQLLLEARAQPNISNAQGLTPLEVAQVSFGGAVPTPIAAAFARAGSEFV
mmetsp:Transcript_110509/g.312591  ORF Transcript_110509/g.312591 Transcript_110509/m.312591 type:complete len:624 (-) Transcript_110509:185-2056(-)